MALLFSMVNVWLIMPVIWGPNEMQDQMEKLEHKMQNMERNMDGLTVDVVNMERNMDGLMVDVATLKEENKMLREKVAKRK